MKIKYTAALALALATLPIQADENKVTQSHAGWSIALVSENGVSTLSSFSGRDADYTIHKDKDGKTFIIGKSTDAKKPGSTIIPFETEADKAKAPKDLVEAYNANEKVQNARFLNDLKVKPGEKKENVQNMGVSDADKKRILDNARKELTAKKDPKIEEKMKQLEKSLKASASWSIIEVELDEE